MIHARRQESGISRSRASRSDRLYRVSCLFVHFLAPFPPLSHRHLTLSLLRSFPLSFFFSLSSLCFFMLGQRRRTENYRRYLDRTRYRFFSASSLHTRAKSDAQTDNQRPENGGPLKLRQAWLTRRSFVQIILFPSIWRTTCVIVFNEIPENRYRYACEFSSPSD